MGSAPERIGKYSIARRLGRGGMGEVWLGRNPDLDIPVAIKTLAPHLVDDDPSFVERFVLEARTAARLNHPHIVRIFDAGSDDGVHYLVMEYVEGGSLRELLATTGPLPVGRALSIAAQVARGLEAAARLGIIHRDIKPDNILLDADGTPKLADLGLAKLLGPSDGASLTHTGTSVGTPGYISPEQAQDSKSVDARADLYSLGATLYHMLTGEPPYSGSSAFAVMMKHVQEPIPDPRARNPGLPEPVVELLVRLLAKAPRDRPQTAAELARCLEELARANEAAPDRATPASAPRGAIIAPDAVTVLATAALCAKGAPITSEALAPTTLAEPIPVLDRAPPPRGGAAPLPVLAASPIAPAPAPTVLVAAPIAWRATAVAIDLVLVAFANACVGQTAVGFWVVLVLYNGLALPRAGRTVGKHALGLSVIGVDGGPPSPRAAFLRGASYLVSGVLTAGIGFAWVLVDRHQRALHDLIAGTRVVVRRS